MDLTAHRQRPTDGIRVQQKRTEIKIVIFLNCRRSYFCWRADSTNFKIRTTIISAISENKSTKYGNSSKKNTTSNKVNLSLFRKPLQDKQYEIITIRSNAGVQITLLHKKASRRQSKKTKRGIDHFINV